MRLNVYFRKSLKEQSWRWLNTAEQDCSAQDMDVDEDLDIALAECDGESSEAYYEGEGRQAPGEGEGRQAPREGKGRQARGEGEGKEARTMEQAILNQIISVQ